MFMVHKALLRLHKNHVKEGGQVLSLLHFYKWAFTLRHCMIISDHTPNEKERQGSKSDLQAPGPVFLPSLAVYKRNSLC